MKIYLFSVYKYMKYSKSNIVRYLEALPVHDGWATFIVFLLGDPHLLEGGGSQGSDLLLHPVSNTRVHGGASRHHGVGVQVLPDVNIALHDGVVGGLMDATSLHSQEAWLEQSLRAP